MNFSELYDFPHLSDNNFLDVLHSQRQRVLQSKIVLLDWNERYVGEIQGLVTDGSLSIDSKSSVRRTCSLSMVVTDDTVDITGLTGLVGLNRKVKVFIGMQNNLSGYKEEYGEVVWFPMGVFVMTQSSIRHDVGSNTLSLTVQDKMCLLNGEVGGVLRAPVDFAKYEMIEADGSRTEHFNTLYDIIRTSVISFGEEDPARVIISDLPLEVRKAITYDGAKDIYVNTETGEYSETQAQGFSYVIKQGDNIGYKMVDFTVPSKELMKQAGEAVTSVLDDIVKILGNYEYFYDVEGNFRFQEIKNHLNTQNKPYYQLDSGDYVADFSNNGIFYSFVGKENISSFSNSPDWLNIKNDFIVWGTKKLANGASVPVSYHVAIDEPPYIQEYYQDGTPIPWQQTIIDAEKDLDMGIYRSPYYQELIAKWPRTEDNKNTGQWVYDKDTKEWNSDASFYLDLIDTNSEIGKYSVANIGRRTKVVVDENVKLMYPPKIEDNFIIDERDYPQGNITFSQAVEELKFQGLPFIAVRKNDGGTLSNKITGALILKDAFSEVRNLLFSHSTMNEVVNINCVPLYFFDVNKKIEVSDKSSNIGGYYMVTSLNIPLSVEGQMNISAIRANSRI